MQLNDIKKGSNKKDKKRVGRGGKRGTYSGRGIKGQKARAGHRIPSKEEKMIKRLPKLRGVKFNPKNPDAVVINVGDLERVFDSEKITKDSFIEAGLIKKRSQPVKILGDGEIKKVYTVEVPVSSSAKKKIEKAGGEIVTNEPKNE